MKIRLLVGVLMLVATSAYAGPMSFLMAASANGKAQEAKESADQADRDINSLRIEVSAMKSELVEIRKELHELNNK